MLGNMLKRKFTEPCIIYRNTINDIYKSHTMQNLYKFGSIETEIWVGFNRFESEYGSMKRQFSRIFTAII